MEKNFHSRELKHLLNKYPEKMQTENMTCRLTVVSSEELGYEPVSVISDSLMWMRSLSSGGTFL